MKVKASDIILIVLLLLLCFSPLLFIGGRGITATVSINGITACIIELDKDYTKTFDGLGTIVVKNGKIHFENALCPDKSCEKTGEIYRSGQSIICIPNRLVIRIDGESEVDGIAQ
ncbi:MAG: hypothetical protein DBX47_00680 [Clostridiales bacterium]|nr:MAG: hypothetical protein DBX47_00680 [Clostridiales bacterium]